MGQLCAIPYEYLVYLTDANLPYNYAAMVGDFCHYSTYITNKDHSLVAVFPARREVGQSSLRYHQPETRIRLSTRLLEVCFRICFPANMSNKSQSSNLSDA
jgi:hypothetical protein